MTNASPRFWLLLMLALALLIQNIAFAVESLEPETLTLHDQQRHSIHQTTSIGLIDLDRIIQPITTITEFANGRKEFNVGNGFVVGRYYFTVYHNLTSFSASGASKKTIYLDGMPLTPVYAHAEKDVAVFVLPDNVCAKYCNDLSFGTMSTLEPDQRVY